MPATARPITAFPASVPDKKALFLLAKARKRMVVQEPEQSMGKDACGAGSGEGQVLTKEKLQERIAASNKTAAPVVSLRIPVADLALARKQAEQKGLPYQTCIKSLLHETLVEREKGKVGW